MRVLVLSHTRCGSTTLCKWLSNELDIELDETPYNPKTFNIVFQKNNIIRKIVAEEYIPTIDIINKFDKVICLIRENSIDSSISFIVANNNKIKDIKSFSANLSIPFKYNTLSYDFSRSEFKGQNQGQNSSSTLTGFSQSSKITIDRILLNNSKLRLSTNALLIPNGILGSGV